MMYKSSRYPVVLLLILAFSVALFLGVVPVATATDSPGLTVAGRVYTFEEDSHYAFSRSDAYAVTEESNTYGHFRIAGEIVRASRNGDTASYQVTEEGLVFHYTYDDALLHEDVDSWHLAEDSGKQIDILKLESAVGKGTIIVQTSRDGLNWVTAQTSTNVFDEVPISDDPIYTTTEIERINGCYYRIIVAYKLRIRQEVGNFLFFSNDKYDEKWAAEVYQFHAYTDTGSSELPDADQIYSLGSRVRAKNHDGYSGQTEMDRNDIHYGWELGSFFVSGYTDEVVESDGNVVFLKNAGDRVTLWFKLNQNINAINGNEKLTVTPDGEGYDQYFETPKMDFGRGVLIIRYTDHNNVHSDPIIYTNYLEANVTVGADTKVQLFEEGDYEVALDYEITSDQLVDKIGHYRIFFRFSVRNGNCMVFPFDVVTGSELTNSSMTENGFRLDLAKSRYLKINVKREVLTESADGLVEDVRFNGPAKDGAEYTSEGIYTITATNLYTGETTPKKIYVGTNNILKAHMTSGLSIAEINNLVEQGATISNQGIIELAAYTPETEASTPPDTQEATTGATAPTTQASPPDVPDETIPADQPASAPFGLLAGVMVAVVVAVVTLLFLVAKRKKQSVREKEGVDER